MNKSNFKYISSSDIEYQIANLRQITFEITDACNLNCFYCGYGKFYSDYDKRENKNLEVEKALILLDYLSVLWQSNKNNSSLRDIYIGFYGGEPLLNIPFIKQIIAYLEQLKISTRKFTYTMTSNAILLDKYMDFLVEHRFNLLISLDGNKENHAYRVDYMGNNSFDRVIKNIRLLQKTHPEYFDQCVNFNAVLHNKNSYESVYRFIKDEFNKIPTITELNDMGIREDMKSEFKVIYRNTQTSLMQSEHYEEINKDMFIKSGDYQSLTTFLHQYNPCVFKDYNELLYGKNDKQIKCPTGTCYPFSRKMFVTVNGKILPCERIGQQYYMGKITDTLQIDLDFETIAEKHNTYLKKVSSQCVSCENQKTCIQCVYNLENLENYPICHGYMDKEEFEKYVQTQFYFLEKHPEDYYKIMQEVFVK